LFLQVTTTEPTKVRAIIQDYKGEITNTFEINGKSQVQGWIPPDYIYQVQSESSVELIGLPPTRIS
jgi:hypothetical protein